MSDYKRRNINIDKLSSYVRRTGICTEEAALHLMDEIMFLRADVKTLRDEMQKHQDKSIAVAGEMIGDIERLDKQITILRRALERVAQVLPGGNTLRERTCWEIVQAALQDEVVESV